MLAADTRSSWATRWLVIARITSFVPRSPYMTFMIRRAHIVCKVCTTDWRGRGRDIATGGSVHRVRGEAACPCCTRRRVDREPGAAEKIRDQIAYFAPIHRS